ncbi:MAG TPA: TRAP transporter substrate-binding protein [Roseiflexaceae bacterium]|nr:TRAP transporter substrate-binding protein [Roseiflexaceae bacterium]
MLKSCKALFVASAFTVAALGNANAEQVNLRMATAIPQGAVQNTLIFDPWIEKVNNEAKGEVRITNTYASLVNVMTIYDAVSSGVVDIAWVLHGFTPGKFPKSSVVQLPFEATTADEASFALWRLFERGIIADEYKDVKVFGLHGFTQAAFHSKQPVLKLADIKGLKVRISSKILADVITQLGGTPVSLSSVQAYQHLSRGVVDADFVQWTIVCVARINEAAPYHLEGQLGGQGAMIIMNKAAWEKLSPAAKSVFEKNAGSEFSVANGKLQDKIHTDCREQTKKMPNQAFKEIDDKAVEEWKAAVAPVVRAWTEGTPGGKDILQAYRDELAAFKKRK